MLSGAELVSTTPASASTAAAVCTLAGQAGFTGPLTVSPSSVAVSISASGTCVSSYTQATSVTFMATGSMLLSCAGGEGALSTSFYFNSSLPPLESPAASAVAAGTSMSLVFADQSVAGDVELAWSTPLSVVACVPGVGSGAISSVPVSGTFVAFYI